MLRGYSLHDLFHVIDSELAQSSSRGLDPPRRSKSPKVHKRQQTLRDIRRRASNHITFGAPRGAIPTTAERKG